MKCKNYVELIGVVGMASYVTAGERRFCRMSVATNFAYRDRDNCPVISTTWSHVTLWEKESGGFPDNISKGDKVHVIGRLNCQRYTGEDGQCRFETEILATSVEVLDCEGCLEMEM